MPRDIINDNENIPCPCVERCYIQDCLTHRCNKPAEAKERQQT